MPYRIFAFTFLTLSLTVCGARAEDGPARQTVRAALEAQPEFILNGGPMGEPLRHNIDSVRAAIPPAIAAAVKDWTGIADRGHGITVKHQHVSDRSHYAATSYSDTGSFRGSITTIGKDPVRTETHVRYKAALAASNKMTFSVLGILEFENAVTGRKCHVICHIEGEKAAVRDPDAVIHPTGTATWSGPILNASTDLFAKPDRSGDDGDRR